MRVIDVSVDPATGYMTDAAGNVYRLTVPPVSVVAATRGEIGREPAPLDRAIATIIDSLRSGGTLYACGNGGSDAHAGHLVAELVGRFAYDRPPLRAIHLSSGGPVGSCIANDYGFGEVFARQVEALCRVAHDSNDDEVRDCLVVFSTSGKSVNIKRAIIEAARNSVPVVALLGPADVEIGGPFEARLHAAIERTVCVHATATTTPAIQEQHQAWVHEIARRVEMELCPR